MAADKLNDIFGCAVSTSQNKENLLDINIDDRYKLKYTLKV